MHFYKTLKSCIGFILLSLVVCKSMQAQIGNTSYPISISPVIYPPFPTSLQFLSVSTTPSIYITITNKSSNATIQNVLLGIQISSGSFIAQTRSINNTMPFTLVGNTPLRLSNVDFAQLFNASNLSGITPQQYISSFQQGTITYGFVLYDAVTKLQLSNLNTYQITFAVNNPPILQAPINRALIVERGVQNVLFQWQPRQSTVQGSVIYKLQILRMIDTTISPQMAFAGTPNYFFEDSTTSTTYIYDAFKKALEPNRIYAWRIQAIAKDYGGFTSTIFDQNGFTQAESFRYAADCKSPTQVIGSNITANSANISWSTLTNGGQTFRIAYKPQNAAVWTEMPISITNNNNSFVLNRLIQSTAYNVKIIGACFGGLRAESVVYNFTTTNLSAQAINPVSNNPSTINTNNKLQASCNTKPPAVVTDERNLMNLSINESFTAGDFSISVVSIESANNGSFSGTGIAEVWLNDKTFRVSVRFTNINIDANRKVKSGNIVTTTN